MRIGTDIVEVARINQAITNGQMNFIERVYTQNEIIKINPSDINYERASGFWAAKEAMVKAVGCGFRNGIRFHDIEVIHDEYGCPQFVFSGRLKEILADKGIENVALSISHCRTHAVATVIIY